MKRLCLQFDVLEFSVDADPVGLIVVGKCHDPVVQPLGRLETDDKVILHLREHTVVRLRVRSLTFYHGPVCKPWDARPPVGKCLGEQIVDHGNAREVPVLKLVEDQLIANQILLGFFHRHG
ncbi:hypothetical protein D3C76_1226190 [compost metagenome]